jgi:hypothetical protein
VTDESVESTTFGVSLPPVGPLELGQASQVLVRAPEILLRCQRQLIGHVSLKVNWAFPNFSGLTPQVPTSIRVEDPSHAIIALAKPFYGALAEFADESFTQVQRYPTGRRLSRKTAFAVASALGDDLQGKIDRARSNLFEVVDDEDEVRHG